MEPNELKSFCWHRREFDRVLSTLMEGSPVLLQGGRGLGKTHTLGRIADTLRADPNNAADEVVFIKGAAKRAARARVMEEGASAKWLLIDDVDLLFEPDNLDTLDSIAPILTNLSGIVFGTARVALSTTLSGATLYEREQLMGSASPEWAEKWANLLSGFFQRLNIENLDPWFPGWKSEFERDLYHLAWPGAVGSNAKETLGLKKLWSDAILEETGRYPSLTADAIEFLQTLLGPKATDFANPRLLSLVNPSFSPDRKGAIKIALEDILGRSRHFRAIKSVIRSWRDVGEGSQKQALETLQQISRTGEDGLDISSLEPRKVREAVLISGLCYEDTDTGRHKVPGTLIRRELLEDSTLLKVLDNEGGETGRLLLQDGSEVLPVELSGAPWRVLKFLSDHKGEETFWSIEAIRQGAGLNNERAVQNAIQRLQKALEELRPGLEECIANRRGEGYRFVGLTRTVPR